MNKVAGIPIGMGGQSDGTNYFCAPPVDNNCPAGTTWNTNGAFECCFVQLNLVPGLPRLCFIFLRSIESP